MAGSRGSTPAKLTKVQALAEFQAQPDLASNITAVAERWGVSRGTVRNWLTEWTAAAPGTAMATTVLPPLPSMEAPPLQWHIAHGTPTTRPGVACVDVAAYTAAVGLAAVAAFFSIKGMVVLFPVASLAVVVMAFVMEGAKLVTAEWLARRWRVAALVWRTYPRCARHRPCRH